MTVPEGVIIGILIAVGVGAICHAYIGMKPFWILRKLDTELERKTIEVAKILADMMKEDRP